MATFVLIPGAGSGTWVWHLMAPVLEARDHVALPVALPNDDPDAGIDDYVAAVLNAIGDRAQTDELAIVAQSLGGFTAAVVAGRVPAKLLVYINAMIPAPGETAGEWWRNVDHAGSIPELRERFGPMATWSDEAQREVFVHDLPKDLAIEAGRRAQRQSAGPFASRSLLDEYPDVPTRVIATAGDRLFPPDFQRRISEQRLSITPDMLPGGHMAMLSQSELLANRIADYWDELCRRIPGVRQPAGPWGRS